MHKKPLSTATAFVYLAITACVLVQLLPLRNGGARGPQPPVTTLPIVAAVPAALEEDVRAAQNLLARDPDAAMQHIERALARSNGAAAELQALLHTWAAEVHAHRWHWRRARNALNSAIALAPTASRDRQLTAVQESIDRSEGERGTAQLYLAARTAGPARELNGRVVIAYLLVDPTGPGRWTDVDRVFARNTLTRVERWYATKAEARSLRVPVFIQRTFEIPTGADVLPLLRNLYFARSTATQLATNLGHNSVGELLARLLQEESADQAVLLIHSPQRARSFADRCSWRSAICDGEIALIFVAPGPNAWDELAFTVAHEALHLFGADDLYNLRGAESYAPTDIMHSRSRRLEYADFDDLTAWAVGWLPSRPSTPFTVEE